MTTAFSGDSQPLEGDPDRCQLPQQLDTVVLASLAKLPFLVRGNGPIAGLAVVELLNYCIWALEYLTRERLKFARVRYCDYEAFYVLFQLVARLASKPVLSTSPAHDSLMVMIKAQLAKQAPFFSRVQQFFGVKNGSAPATPEATDEDPLVLRLRNLNTGKAASKLTTKVIPLSGSLSPSLANGSSNGSSKGSSNGSTRSTFTGETRENLDVAALATRLRKDKVLVIDFQPRAAYDARGSINYGDVIHIDPEWVASEASKREPSWAGLDERLRIHMSASHYKRWLRLADYDLVAVYGSSYKRSFTAVNAKGEPESPPFWPLFNLLVPLADSSPSPRLAKYPVYLDGGLAAWEGHFGAQGVSRGPVALAITPPQPSLARGTSFTRPQPLEPKLSPYLRNFGDYLSLAKPRADERRKSAGSPGSVGTHYNKAGYLVPSSRPQRTYTPEPSTPKQRPDPKPKSPTSSLTTKVVSLPPSDNTKDPDFLHRYVTGLYNLGNSCYMNCMLQCLGATPQLTQFFFPSLANPQAAVLSYRDHINMLNKLGTKGILTHQFVDILKQMFAHDGRAFSPSGFKKAMGSLSPNHQFATCDQQDCIEFLDFMLDRLHEDLNQPLATLPDERKRITELTPDEEATREQLPVRLALTIEWERYLRLNFSVVVDYFQGQYLSQLRCLECGNTSTTYNAFSILSLPIPERLGGQKQVLISQLLDEYTTTELLDNDNRWKCPKCQRQTKLTKTIKLTRLPQVLIVHFKRFKLNERGYFNKLDTFVTYPVNQELDLTPFWTGRTGTAISDSQHLMTAQEEEEYLKDIPTRRQQPPFRYKLYGVANHFGLMTTGHYTSYVYKLSDRKKTRRWCYFDDEKITYNCLEQQVLNKNAYCLFFERV